MFLGVALACILFFPRIEGGIDGWIKVFNKGAADSGVSILNTAIVVGFGGVVKNTGVSETVDEELKAVVLEAVKKTDEKMEQLREKE